MNTEDLSKQTYKGIILTSERFNHNLALQFAVLTSCCKDDDDYLNRSEEMINNWLAEWNTEEIIDDIFDDQKVNMKAFKKTLNKLLMNIENIRKTPITEREF